MKRGGMKPAFEVELRARDLLGIRRFASCSKQLSGESVIERPVDGFYAY